MATDPAPHAAPASPSRLDLPVPQGEPHHSPSCLRKPFIAVLAKVEIGRSFSSHGLRRTANDLLRRVASGEVTRAITGHATTAMTDRYSHVDIGEKRNTALGMLRLVRGSEDAEDDPDAN